MDIWYTGKDRKLKRMKRDFQYLVNPGIYDKAIQYYQKQTKTIDFLQGSLFMKFWWIYCIITSDSVSPSVCLSHIWTQEWYRVSSSSSFCLISLATNLLESWDINHWKGGIHSFVWSTKTFLYNIWEPRYK